MAIRLPRSIYSRGDGQLGGQRLGGSSLVHFEVFEPQFELADIGVQVRRTRAEVACALLHYGLV